MSGKIYNLSEKAMTEKYEDYVFTKVMALYAEEESARILSEIDTENRADPKEIEKIYSKIERRENLSTLWKYSRKLLQFAAMVVFVAVISLSSTVVAFAEVREAVAEAIYHLIIKDYGRYTQITIGESTAFIDPEIYTWEDAYAPTYMPEGFELGNFSCTSSQQSVDYYCGEDYIAIIQGRNSTGQIDTENAEIVENLIIGDSNALFVVKDDTTYVSWIMGDNMFLVIGSAAPEEILKVAKSIKPLGHFKTEEPEEEYTFVDPEIYDWEGAYGLTYVPEGFNLSGVYRYTGNRIIDYKKENEYFSFLQAYEATADVDTEGAQKIDKILIGDSEGLLVVKNGLTTVSWHIKNTYMTILGTAPTDEIIKMAKGIKPISKTEPAEEYEFVDPEIYDWEGGLWTDLFAGRVFFW
ncbi:MAG: DUF4367 domain-containing protein [Oscillospiraceae bacterium]|nr:DUF4367 domain-containing protein [Oscillospiraceae bacterium]